MEMEIENDIQSEEDMLNLAIQMSLTQEERRIQEENEKSRQEQEKIEEEKPKDSMIEELPTEYQRFSFLFARFDISRDLLDILFNNIAEVNTQLEEYGFMFKFIYKILKMQQLVSYKMKVPFDRYFIQALAQTLYQRVFFCFLFFLYN